MDGKEGGKGRDPERVGKGREGGRGDEEGKRREGVEGGKIEEYSRCTYFIPIAE